MASMAGLENLRGFSSTLEMGEDLGAEGGGGLAAGLGGGRGS